jgi:hypothetical protein
VNNASALGRGGMEIAVNGARTDQNDFQMDGVSVVNFGSSGTGNRGERLPYHRNSQSGHDCRI